MNYSLNAGVVFDTVLNRNSNNYISPGGGPSWAPSTGQIKNIGLNTINSIDPANDPLANPNYPSTPPWLPTGVFWIHALDYCGAILADNYGANGTYMIYGGAGHSAPGANCWIGFDLTTQLWAVRGNRPLPSDDFYAARLDPGNVGLYYPSSQLNATWGEWQGNYSGWPGGFAQSGYNPPEGGHTRNSFVYRKASKAGNTTGQIIACWEPTGETAGTGIAGSFFWDGDTSLFSRSSNVRPNGGSTVGGMKYSASHDVVIGINQISSGFPSIDFMDCATKTWTRRATTNTPNIYYDTTCFIWNDYIIFVNNSPVTVTNPPFQLFAVNITSAIAGTVAFSNALTVNASTTYPVDGAGLSYTMSFAPCPENNTFYAVNRVNGSNKMWKLTPPVSNIVTDPWALDEQTMTSGTLDGRLASGSSGTSFDFSRLQWSTYGRAFIWIPDYVSGNVQALRPTDIV